jgi:hypothetical protein
MTESPKECTLYGSPIEENSMLYWFPKLKEIEGLASVLPMTRIARIHRNTWELQPVCDGDFSVLEGDWERIRDCADTVGWPVFMRTDELSAKHSWNKTCFVEKKEDLKKHISELVEQSLLADMMGLPVRAFVMREYIPMDEIFKAFDGMPVNPELRFFVKDHKIHCWHWYWIKEAIRADKYHDPPLPVDWEARMDAVINSITQDEMKLLESYVMLVAEKFDGGWSVDFCRGLDKRWWLIDMAKMEVSYHPVCSAGK